MYLNRYVLCYWRGEGNNFPPECSSAVTSSILCCISSFACSKRPAWPPMTVPGRIRAVHWLMEPGALWPDWDWTVHWLMKFRLRARDRGPAVHWLTTSSTVASVSHVLWVRIKSQSIHFFLCCLFLIEMVKTRQIDIRFVHPALRLPCVLLFFERLSVRTSHGEYDLCQSDFSNLCLETVLHFEFLSSSHLQHRHCRLFLWSVPVSTSCVPRNRHPSTIWNLVLLWLRGFYERKFTVGVFMEFRGTCDNLHTSSGEARRLYLINGIQEDAKCLVWSMPMRCSMHAATFLGCLGSMNCLWLRGEL